VADLWPAFSAALLNKQASSLFSRDNSEQSYEARFLISLFLGVVVSLCASLFMRWESSERVRVPVGISKFYKKVEFDVSSLCSS
jgi:hypothetical protein